jgi:hypothetical protein
MFQINRSVLLPLSARVWTYLGQLSVCVKEEHVVMTEFTSREGSKSHMQIHLHRVFQSRVSFRICLNFLRYLLMDPLHPSTLKCEIESYSSEDRKERLATSRGFA